MDSRASAVVPLLQRTPKLRLSPVHMLLLPQAQSPSLFLFSASPPWTNQSQVGSRSILSSQVSCCFRAIHCSANEETRVQEENDKPRGHPTCKLAEMRSQIQVTLGQIGFPANCHIPQAACPLLQFRLGFHGTP